jgi:hypothetical protein
MKGKRPELGAGLIATKGTAAPPADMPTRAAAVPLRAVPPAPKVGEGREALVPLNFRIGETFRREFKTYAASHDLKLNELLRLCFDFYKSRQN